VARAVLKKIPELIRQRRSFQGNSIAAYYRENDDYVIEHLQVVLAVVKPNGQIFYTDRDQLGYKAQKSFDVVHQALKATPL
jgi:hypothetical protein